MPDPHSIRGCLYVASAPRRFSLSAKHCTEISTHASRWAGNTSDPQQDRQLVHHLLSGQNLKTGATVLDRNSFQTTLTCKPLLYLSCRTLAKSSNVQVQQRVPSYHLLTHPAAFQGPLCPHMSSTAINSVPHHVSAFPKMAVAQLESPFVSFQSLPQNLPSFCPERFVAQQIKQCVPSPSLSHSGRI